MLCSDRCDTPARFWEARNAKKGGALMGVDMLLLDDQNFFVKELSGFDVTRSSNHFKLCDSVVGCCICFCGGPEEARLAMERCKKLTKGRFLCTQKIIFFLFDNMEKDDANGVNWIHVPITTTTTGEDQTTQEWSIP
ncbi:unnamed protein product, partial [Brassica napus]